MPAILVGHSMHLALLPVHASICLRHTGS